MAATLLDGDRLFTERKAELALRVKSLGGRGRSVGLGTILVGDDVPSARYVALKHEDCAEIGVDSYSVQLPATATEPDVIAAAHEFNDDSRVDAFLIQVPLPNGIDEERCLLEVDPDKDVDGLHPVNLGRLVLGRPKVLPCTPAGIVELLAAYDVPVEGRHVVIIGRGITIGRPLALLLALKRPGCNAAVTVVHSAVERLDEFVRSADIVVSAAGQAGLVTAQMVKPGAAVVGAGTSWSGRRLLSDLDEEVGSVAGWVTPRLGGVGPMTRAMLLENAVTAAERRG